MEYDHNQICGVDVAVGNTYCYYEDGMVCNVKVLEDNTDDEGLKFKLKVMEAPPRSPFSLGAEFDVFAAAGCYAYSGMWRLYPKGEYGSWE